MRKLIFSGLLLAASITYAQAAEPTSTKASNIMPGSPEVAKQLPAPQAAGDTVADLLTAASSALKAGHTGAAQEALEQAETRALDRSVPYTDNDKAIADPVVTDISDARQALGSKDVPGAMKAIQAAQTAEKST